MTYYVDGWLGNNGYDGLAATALSSSHGPMRNISQAIAAASDGDTIVAAPGCYQETLWEAGSKSVTLAGPGTVIITGSDPVTTSSTGDGLPDAWVAAQGLNPFDPGVVSLASSLPWANGTNNLAAYQLSQIPPTITATITPAPNAAGWNNTNVVVHFSASSTGSGVAWVTSDITITSATNNCEVTGYAMDNAGNPVSTSMILNIDQTPPIITLDPGTGQTLDHSHPLLLIQYADSDTNVPPATVSSGLDLSSLQILLDSTDVTSNFYTFASGAVGNGANLVAGTHTWSATIADTAGNVTSTSVTFTATGAVNPNAPTMSSLNFVDDVTVMPDVSEIWVQGRISDTNASVAASVSGREPVTMNKRGNVFGYLLPVDFGTNVVVLLAADASEQNLSSRVLLVERSNRYRAAITSPGFGAYANGNAVTVSGYVSAKKDEGLATEEPLESVTVNGVATTLDWAHVDADENVPFATVAPVPVATDGSPTAFSLHITWPSEDTMPCWYVEGYLITSKMWSKKFTEQYFFPAWSPSMPPPTGCTTWSTSSGAGYVFETNGTFDTSTTGEVCNSYDKWHTNNQCVATWNLDAVSWDTTTNYPTTTNPLAYTNLNQPSFALEFGTTDDSQDYLGQGDGWSDELVYVSRSTDNGILTYNAPFHYTNQPVIFTFEGLSYESSGTNIDWHDVKFRLNSPNGPLIDPIGPGSYPVTVSGGEPGYKIDSNSFVWPPAVPAVQQTVTTNNDNGDIYFFHEEESSTTHHLSFTGFQNHETLKIMWDNVNITGSNVTTIVGQRIILTAEVASGLLATSYQWTVPPNRVADYHIEPPGTTNGWATMTSFINTTSNNVNFCWVNQGPKQVSCSVTLTNGLTVTGKTTFNVKTPTVNYFTSITGPIDIIPNPNPLAIFFGSPWVLSCGNENQTGIVYTAQVTAPISLGGRLKFTQVVAVNHQRTVNTIVDSTESLQIPAWWLDGKDPSGSHGGPYDIDGGQQIAISDSDMPYQPLTYGYNKYEVKFDRFQLYLMFKPSVDSIWVPISRITWGWNGVAVSSDGGTNWSKLSGSQITNNPPGSNVTAFPQWTNVVSTIFMNPGWHPD